MCIINKSIPNSLSNNLKDFDKTTFKDQCYAWQSASENRQRSQDDESNALSLSAVINYTNFEKQFLMHLRTDSQYRNKVLNDQIQIFDIWRITV